MKTELTPEELAALLASRKKMVESCAGFTLECVEPLAGEFVSLLLPLSGKLIAAAEERDRLKDALEYYQIATNPRTGVTPDETVLAEVQKDYGGAIAHAWLRSRKALAGKEGA